MANNRIILVDENDVAIGECEKLAAHQNQGQRHRAFSVFVQNKSGELLLQKRASDKYHAPGLWSNTCCSHPQPGEETIDSAKARLNEEMGIVCELEKIAVSEYKTDVGNSLVEWELVHLFKGSFEGGFEFNSAEVEDVKWLSVEQLASELEHHAKAYTPWLKILFPLFKKSFI